MSARRTWTDAELQRLRVLYQDHSAAECAAAIGRSVASVNNQVNKLGLRKSREWMAKRARENSQRPDHGGRAHTFKRGQPAWNAGMKGLNLGGESGHFKKGRPPHEAQNYRPIGSTRVCRDGYLERKVSDDQSIQPARRWVAAHRLVWEAANGPIPAGHIVRFRAGMATTVADEITIDRLELVHRAENMALNSIHNYPAPVKSLIRAVKRAERALENRSE